MTKAQHIANIHNNLNPQPVTQAEIPDISDSSVEPVESVVNTYRI